MLKLRTVGDEDLRRIIEEPGEEIGRSIEEGWKSGIKRKIGDAGTDIATEKKKEPKHGK